MLNFNQLRIFHHAAQHLNFTVAARELSITQPAVTIQIKALERQCGMNLFKRQGRRFSLTDEGRTLYEYTAEMFNYEKEIENAIEDMRTLQSGTLRLGTTKAYARYLMPALISRFHKIFPNIKILLDEGSSQDMINSLATFKNEVAVIARTIEHPETVFVPFRQEELVIIMATGHPLAHRAHLTLQMLAKEPFIMKENGSGTRKYVNDLFIRNRYTPNILMETGNNELIKQMVQQGEGVSILVKACVAEELERNQLTMVALKDERLYLEVSFAYCKNQPLSPPAKAFDELLSKMC